MTARFGLLLPTRETVLWAGGDAGALLGIAEAAETAGWDSVWAGDSIVARPRLDPVALLSAVAGRTRRVTVGTAVFLPLLRHPTVAAHELATLDRISGGRLVVGVGPAASIPATDEELQAVGAPAGRRVGRLLEAVDAWRQAWSAEGGGLAPARSGGPPVWLAAAGPRTLRLTGERFDGWLPYCPTPGAYRDDLGVVRAAAAGRAVTPAQYATVTVGEPEAARDELDAYLAGYYGVGLDLMGHVQACFAGPLDEAAAWIASFVVAGAEHVVVRLGHRDLTRHVALAAALRMALGEVGR